VRFLLGFATLALRAELEKRMRAADLHKAMTDAAVLDELGKAKALVNRCGNRILLEVSKKQRTLLAALKVPELTYTQRHKCPAVTERRGFPRRPEREGVPLQTFERTRTGRTKPGRDASPRRPQGQCRDTWTGGGFGDPALPVTGRFAQRTREAR
jgi:hypothetical protein